MKSVVLLALATVILTSGFLFLYANSEKALQLKASTTITLYDYMDCVTTTCADIQCTADDKVCTNASQKYQTCFSGYQPCQQWYQDEYKVLNSDDYLPTDYFQCDQKCRPNQSTSGKYWQVYSCQALCGGINLNAAKTNLKSEKPILEEKTIIEEVKAIVPTGSSTTKSITLFDYMECVTTTCAGQVCSEGDKVCTGASTNYQACFAKNADCQKWYSDEYGQLSSDDQLPPEFYKCDQACRPSSTTSGNYFGIYSCQAQCGGIDTKKKVAAPVKVTATSSSTTTSTITLYDYMDCVTTTCANIQCANDDKVCTNASQKYQTCFSGYQQCQQWYQDEYKNLNSDDYLPSSYFNCDAKCRPNQSTSGKFWDVYACQAACADLSLK